ncbi:MAG: hypothetical protein GY787_32025 [Alteromonadales bacterium]|nr:hypothetical protein [Alteromonadales bacterium]
MDIVSSDLVAISNTSLKQVTPMNSEPTRSLEQSNTEMQDIQMNLQGELWIMKMVIEQMLGKEITLSEPLADSNHQTSSLSEVNIQSIQLHGKIETIQAEQINSDFILTAESTQQSTSRLSLNQQVGVEGGEQVVDPLVINLSRDFADLESAKFYFDLDVDGKKDWVPQLSQGSAFLALDKNGNQQIDDGNELFGPQSGDGFTDLAKYDDNQDGKIDISDAVFEQLKVWRSDGELLALVEVGVASISLHAVVDEKQLHSENGKLLGIARKSGEFIRNDGQVGRMQHIDMVI